MLDAQESEANSVDSPSPSQDTPVSDDGGGGTGRRRRRPRPFPALPFEEALVLGTAIQTYAAGQEVRRLTLFDHMKREPDSSTSRVLITSSNQYGITNGSYRADVLSLTDEGRIATSDTASPRDQLIARFGLAVSQNQYFAGLYQTYLQGRLPATAIMKDKAEEFGVDPDYSLECVETFIVNCKFLGLLRPVAGAERLLPVDQVADDYLDPGEPRRSPGGNGVNQVGTEDAEGVASGPRIPASSEGVSDEFDTACFYISPIGDEESEARQHSDLFMGSLVEPALGEFGLRLVRADQIGKAGLISAQMIEYLVRSKLVIADLSFNNPNVFYELAIRHTLRRPVVQLIRKCDHIPFDVNQVRTVVIDTGSIYTLVPRLDTYRAEIASQIRLSLDGGSSSESPLSVFYPQFWDAMPISSRGSGPGR